MTTETDILLQVDDLHVSFETDVGTVSAVDGVSFDIRKGETLALVGESGCGKSVTAMAVLRLIESQRGQIGRGSIHFDGSDLLALSEEAMRRVRGNDISMIFQEPMTSLNPVYSVGDQIGEALRLHLGRSRERARKETLQLLQLVGIPDPEQRIDEYPHQMSGGMRQRVMIAMALSCKPKLLIADEPTTALDVTIQAQILELIRRLQEELGMSVLLITHDLGVVASVAHRVAVMYAGRVAERADVQRLFKLPQHPYTAGLLQSLPKLDGHHATLKPIEGNVPDAMNFPDGCRFNPRCRYAFERCRQESPPLIATDPSHPNHVSACWVTQAEPGKDLLRE